MRQSELIEHADSFTCKTEILKCWWLWDIGFILIELEYVSFFTRQSFYAHFVIIRFFTTFYIILFDFKECRRVPDYDQMNVDRLCSERVMYRKKRNCLLTLMSFHIDSRIRYYKVKSIS